jgi:hypothetical protein
MVFVNCRLFLFALVSLVFGTDAIALQTSNTLWSASHESGTLSQWNENNGGGEFNRANGDSEASQDFAHTGLWSAKLTNPGASDTYLSRWAEPQNNLDLHYTVWYYFPGQHAASWWNVMQWISVSPTRGTSPVYMLNVGNRSDGSMYFYLLNWPGRRYYTQTVKDIPVGQWFKLDAYYQCATDGTGRVTVWQDGTELFDVQNVSTNRFSDSTCEWRARNYAYSASPSPVIIYIDDAELSIVEASPTPLTILPTTLPSGTVGTSYSAGLTGSGGTEPYTWSVAIGALPPGLTLSHSGTLSGTPTRAGTFGFNVQIRDSASAITTSAQLTIEVAPLSPLGSGNIIWSADHEGGNMDQWNLSSGGGEFNSGIGESVISTERAHTGRYGVRMNITTPPESGTRMFRWYEPQRNPRLQYSAWFYFPERYSVGTYWNIFQWKSKRSSSQIDPFFVLNIGNRSDGSMFLYLYDWQNRRAYSQSVRNLPVDQWVKIEAYYQCAGDSTGRVTFWQDGTQLFDLQNVRTRYSDGDCQWSIDNYSSGLSPSPAVIYADDAQIIEK